MSGLAVNYFTESSQRKKLKVPVIPPETGNLCNVYSFNCRGVEKENSENFVVDGEITAFQGSLTSFYELQKR